MSFFKKLTKEFDELKAKFTDDDETSKTHEASKAKLESDRGEADAYYGTLAQPAQASGYDGSQAGAYGAPAPQQYGQQYGNQPQSQQYAYGSSHPGQAPQHLPPGSPPCPPGWSAQWDQNSQRWCYLEQATGRTQWDPPQVHSVAGQHGSAYGVSSGQDASRGYGSDTHSAYGQGANHGAYGQSQYDHSGIGGHEKQKKSGSNAMLYGVGGLAAGAIGGALIVDALSALPIPP